MNIAVEPLDKDKFFDGIVAKLHTDGVLQNFETPKGTLRPKAQKGSRMANLLGICMPSKPSSYGTVQFIGDVPYKGLTTQLRQNTSGDNINITQEEMLLKHFSVRTAINCYMPADKFAVYLDYFCSTLKSPVARDAIKNSLNILMDDTSSGHRESDNLSTVIEHYKSVILRDYLKYSEVLNRKKDYPELVTALVIYHAAHKAYLTELDKAIERSSLLSTQERANAKVTLDSNEFYQFNGFLIFPTLLPLAIHYYESAEPQKTCPKHQQDGSTTFPNVTACKAKIDPVRMKAAIRQAWQTLFEKEILIRHYRADGQTPQMGEESDSRMVCPAKPHLHASMRDASIERIYDFVTANPAVTLSTMRSINIFVR